MVASGKTADGTRSGALLRETLMSRDVFSKEQLVANKKDYSILLRAGQHQAWLTVSPLAAHQPVERYR